MIKNIFSVDLEECYFYKSFSGKNKYFKHTEQINESITPLLELLEKYKINATFFVSGAVAENNPDIIEKIDDLGHEIASHGYSHYSLDHIGKNNFQKQTVKINCLLKSIIKKKPIGFRAPFFSLNRSTSWALDVLKKNGYKYDSSLFPIKTGVYGVDNVPNYPYFIDANLKKSKKSAILEYPIPTIKIFKAPFIVCGGFYFRLYPFWFTKNLIRTLNRKNKKAVIYIHPWETYTKTRRVKKNPLNYFITYYNIKSALRKIELLFKNFKFHAFIDDLKERLIV